jgi:ABC-2 type transport system permease protein
MSSEGAIFDLDYRRYDGERTGRNKIRLAMVRDGVRKVLGLRRRARRKILPWGLIILALLPAVAIVGFQVFTQGLGADELLEDLIPGHADYFGFTFQLTFLFIALSAPELLIPDRVNNVLTVYASRPLTVADYLMAPSAVSSSTTFRGTWTCCGRYRVARWQCSPPRPAWHSS